MTGASLSPSRKRLFAVLLIAGGVSLGGKKLHSVIKQAQAEQRAISRDVSSKTSGHRAQKIAVDRKFLKRLLVILSICVPSLFSREALLILVQGGLLMSRTLLTDFISRVEGVCGRALISQDFPGFGRGVSLFAAVGIPAAVVNSGLKYMQKQIELAFQQRLSMHLHTKYASNRAYYAASTLGGLTNADQRITEDVEKFSFVVSELYNHTFKPLLDVVLFTRSLASVMGYKGQMGLYVYFVAAAYVLRAMSPPLASMLAQEAALSGAFRAAHQRLVMHSEEVAFNDPPAGIAEQMILNQHLQRLVRYSGLSALQRFIQQIADGYFVKYFASVVALLVYAAPLYFKHPAARGSQGQLTQDYIRSMRLLQNTSKGIGDLILVYKRVTSLASHTSRVSELLENMGQLSGEDAEHRELFRRNVSATHMLGVSDGPVSCEPLLAPQRSTGQDIQLLRVALDAPDGTPLIRELSFQVLLHKSVMLMGPNGSGKSSLFRVLAGLWPLQAGHVTTPAKRDIFYLSQRPYLVSGSLRDQLLYPLPPLDVWSTASAQDRCRFEAVGGASREVGTYDEEMAACLRAVELDYLLTRGAGWEQVQNWNETLSGGEKQRLAMARLLFHRPKFAVLDECTSAVSADGEVKLYEACQAAGITYLSIAHRPAVKRFHCTILHFDGNLSRTGRGWWIEDLQQETTAA